VRAHGDDAKAHAATTGDAMTHPEVCRCPVCWCWLCGQDMHDHDDEACEAKMAAWRPKGISAGLDAIDPESEGP